LNDSIWQATVRQITGRGEEIIPDLPHCGKPGALRLIDEYLSSPGARDEIGYFISYIAGHGDIYALRTVGEAIDIGTIEAYERAKTLLSGEPVIHDD
jgi:NDP-sugar pyrophosphorylase family protein